MVTPKDLKDIPAAHPRRSSFSIHGDFLLMWGRSRSVIECSEFNRVCLSVRVIHYSHNPLRRSKQQGFSIWLWKKVFWTAAYVRTLQSMKIELFCRAAFTRGTHLLRAS